jgi:hypothetical protein
MSLGIHRVGAVKPSSARASSTAVVFQCADFERPDWEIQGARIEAQLQQALRSGGFLKALLDLLGILDEEALERFLKEVSRRNERRQILWLMQANGQKIKQQPRVESKS